MNTSDRKRHDFFRHAATFCLLSPFISIVLTLFIFIPANAAHPPRTRMDALANAVIISITTGLGIVSGIVSFLGVRRYGAKGIVWKSSIGLAIIMLLFAASVPSFLKATKAANARASSINPIAIAM